MIIAQYGNFTLSTKVYQDSHEYYVRDIEIDKFEAEGADPVTVATFSREGALVSCGRRLLESLASQQDVDAIRSLAEIAAMIFDGENVRTGYTT